MEINEELKTECVLANALINRWTVQQAEAILLLLEGLTQDQIASKMNISQSAVNQRIKASNYSAIKVFLQRYEDLVLKLK